MSGIRRGAALMAATLIAAASFAGVTASVASAAPHASPASGFLAEETADGTSAAGAERAAIQELHGDFSGCGAVTLVSDFAIGGGIWEATVESTCTGRN